MPTKAKFNIINRDTWERNEYFDHYYNTIKCKYTLNANLDITELLKRSKELDLKFFPSFLYIIMRAVNQNKEFRMSFDADGNLGYWDYVIPSYTIFHEDDKTFSDVWSEYSDRFETFYQTITHDMEVYKDVKGIKARSGRLANFCPISSLPWLNFTSFSQDTYSESSMLFPLIKFGKHFEENGTKLITIAVFVNHAVADGYHTCKLINDMQDYLDRVDEWILLEK